MMFCMAEGDALAFAEALVNEASKNPSRLDTIAVGLAEATDLSKADASQHLVQEEPVEIARSIANTGEFVTTTGTSLSQVSGCSISRACWLIGDTCRKHNEVLALAGNRVCEACHYLCNNLRVLICKQRR